MRIEANYSQKKIITPDCIEEIVEKLRQEKKKIVTLNGAFDLLHTGHLYMLTEAAKMGDILIVALNSDRSVHSYKGNERPILSLSHRIELLTAFACVDYVTWFEEKDPCALLEKIRPDIHVNGQEYGAECIEAETVKKYGGELHLVDRIPGLATSEIIQKIQKLGKA